MEQNHFMVSVNCLTYNHASYIEDTMNGFCMQETNFPFVCIIIDDASIDGEPEVIKRYVEEHFDMEDKSVVRNEETNDYRLTFARHKANLNCFFVVVFLKYNHWSIKKSKEPYIQEWINTKYVAACDGDDYWTASDKLQKQVDFMETHSDYNVCTHDYLIYFENEKRFIDNSIYSNRFKGDTNSLPFLDYSLDVYFDREYLRIFSCLYRGGDYVKMIPQEKYKYYRDDIFFYYLLKQGKGALLSDTMGVYRIHNGGVWSKIRATGIDKESSIYNAYNIFLVERDVRALKKVKRISVELLVIQMRKRMFRQCIESVKKCYRRLPLKDFLKVLFNASKILIKMSVKKILRIQ